MKRIAKSLVVVGAMLAAGSAAADMMDDVRPYIGLDYYQAWMKGAKGTDSRGASFDFSKEMPKSYPGATVYVGAKFMEYFGAEFGADFSGRKKKTTTDSFGGKTKIEVKRNGVHLDLVGSLPVNDCFEVLGFVGAGWLKPKVSATYTNAAGRVSAENLKAKTTTIARLGVGASYMVTDMIGLRAKLGWENTKRIKLQNTVSPVSTFRAFKDTTTLSLGAFVRW